VTRHVTHRVTEDTRWLEMAMDEDEITPKADATVWPVFPLRTIAWPEHTIELKVIEPAHRQLYDDLLRTGRRTFVAPLARLPPGGHASQETPAEERRIHAIAPVLELLDLQEVGADTGGVVKYIAKHKVVGRARITRILNPSALFETDQAGARVDYLRAEVQPLPDNEPTLDGETWEFSVFQELASTWETLRTMSEVLDEPRLPSKDVLENRVYSSSTWQLLEFWQRLQICTQTYRDKACAAGMVTDWVEQQQQLGNLPAELPKQVDASQIGMPQSLMEAVHKLQTTAPVVELRPEFMAPILEVMAEDDYKERVAMLTELAANQVKVLQARIALRNMLG